MVQIITTKGGGGKKINVVDNLTSTSTSDALSANQGRVLDEKIDTLDQGNVKVSTDEGNLLTPGAKLWFGEDLDFSSIVSPDSNTMYIQYKSGSTPPSPGGWQPGADTLLYMPMDSTSQATDQSGNNVPTSNSGVTFGTYQGVDCGYFDRSHIQITTPFIIPDTITILCRCYNTGYYSSGTDGKIFDTRDSSTYLIFAYTNNDNRGYYCNFPTEVVSNDMHQREWILSCVTITQSGNCSFYSKGANSDTVNIGSGTWGSFMPTTMNVGNEHNNGANRYFLGGLSNLIVESRVRTAQEIADYYNQTKGDYGIS